MKPETKVGFLFILALLLVAGFAYYLGLLSPFKESRELRLLYNFAGGIEVGSPVRAMGIKVGKVKAIDFTPNAKWKDEEVKLTITVEIENKAWPTIKEDSKFYINLAGVIGEKYIEVTPGTGESKSFKSGDLVRGIDPPRIDQLLSQGYALAGKILNIVENNEGTFIDTLDKINNLVTNLNRTLLILEKLSKREDFDKIAKNVALMSDDLLILTSRLRGKEAEETMDLLRELLFRLKDLDEKSIRKFLQDEGIRAKIF